MIDYKPVIQRINLSPEHHTDVLRLDLLHPEISGNKWFKLKKNLESAKIQNKKTIITFGGAYSNHIAATAAACREQGLKAIGVIRGEEEQLSNPTLLKALSDRMFLHFVSREAYIQKDTIQFKNMLTEQFGDHYLIPEGGNNPEGVLGSLEILKPEWSYDYIFCACGTGTTYAGLLAAVGKSTRIIGVSVLKGENTLADGVEKVLQTLFPQKKLRVRGNEALNRPAILDHCITNDYCFNGYAAFSRELLDFKIQFEVKFLIPLDYVYTNKLFFAVEDLIRKNMLGNSSRILIVHSGGLQGNPGFEKRYKL